MTTAFGINPIQPMGDSSWMVQHKDGSVTELKRIQSASLLKHIENDIEENLKKYRFQSNTKEVRAEIVETARTILDFYKNEIKPIDVYVEYTARRTPRKIKKGKTHPSKKNSRWVKKYERFKKKHPEYLLKDCVIVNANTYKTADEFPKAITIDMTLEPKSIETL